MTSVLEPGVRSDTPWAMPPLRVHPLRVHCRARETLELARYPGSAIRGALFGAVRDLACVNPTAPSCGACSLHPVCGVSRLLATVDDSAVRGGEAPRPFVLRPPLDGPRLVPAGELFSFGIVLVGDDALSLLPYLVLGLRRAGEVGMGREVREASGSGPLRRGRFAVESVEAVNPLVQERQAVMQAHDGLVMLPSIPVTAEQVAAWCAAKGEVRRATLHLRTPLRLVVNGGLVQRLTFDALLRRLLRRVSDLTRWPGDDAQAMATLRALLATAAAVRVLEDRTHWLDLDSRSSRQRRTLPIGGLLGSVTIAGDLTPFLPWLLWAEFVGVGKDVTKGNGALELVL